MGIGVFLSLTMSCALAGVFAAYKRHRTVYRYELYGILVLNYPVKVVVF